MWTAPWQGKNSSINNQIFSMPSGEIRRMHGTFLSVLGSNDARAAPRSAVLQSPERQF